MRDGFRLARHLGHAAVHPMDHQMPIGNDSPDFCPVSPLPYLQ